MNDKRKFLFLAFAMLCSFCITAEYAVIKPISHSCFISTYTSNFFPKAWLTMLPINLLFVALYNRVAPKLGLIKTMLCVVTASVSMQIFSAAYLNQIKSLPFILYVWKDIYILFLFQQLWTLIHTVDMKGKERFWYGVIFGAGGIGSILGSLVPGFFASNVGSEKLILAALPFTFLLTFFYFGAIRASIPLRKEVTKKDAEQSSQAGWKILAESRPLKIVLGLVVLMQISTTLVEYQFHQHIQHVLPNQDQRTAYIGYLFSAVNAVNLFFHFIGSSLFVRFFGLKAAHFLIPSVLIFNAIGLFIFPRFGLISYNYGAIKVFDYSHFNIIKEMLYVPHKMGEKFKAKALIDVFAYRSSKTLASIFVLVIPVAFLQWSLLALFFLWGALVYFGVEPHKEEVSEPEPEAIAIDS